MEGVVDFEEVVVYFTFVLGSSFLLLFFLLLLDGYWDLGLNFAFFILDACSFA